MKTAISTFALLLLTGWGLAAIQTDIPLPPEGSLAPHQIAILPNGNIVVTDSEFDQASPPVLREWGWPICFSPEGQLISTLTGSSANDRAGSYGIQVLSNGHFVILSSNWNNGAETNAGAVTWGHAQSGFGIGQKVVVSASNSLVGTSADTRMGEAGVFPLKNGNYLVISPNWKNGPATRVGAFTWCNGSTGRVGVVSASNSLVGFCRKGSVEKC